MAGPISSEERRLASRRLGIGFVSFVGISAALVAIYSGGTPLEVGLVGLAGLAAGGAILLALGVRP